MLVILAAATAAATATASAPLALDAPIYDIQTYLAREGLAADAEVIMRRGGWVNAGGGVDSPGDMRFLSDDVIDSLRMPPVKANILKALASTERERVRHEHDQR